MKISISKLAHVIDYVAKIAHHATFESNRSSGGFPQNRGNITLLWLFCYPVLFFSILRPGRTDAQILTLNGSNDVFLPKDGPFGVKTMDDFIWENMPQKLPKRGVNMQFQAKKSKSTRLKISGTINPTKRFEDPVQTTKGTWSAIIPKQNTTYGWQPPSWKSMTSYFRSGQGRN